MAEWVSLEIPNVLFPRALGLLKQLYPSSAFLEISVTQGLSRKDRHGLGAEPPAQEVLPPAPNGPTPQRRGRGAGTASGHHHHVSQRRHLLPAPNCKLVRPWRSVFCSVPWAQRPSSSACTCAVFSGPPPACRQPLGLALVSYVVAAKFFLGVGVGVGGSALLPAGRVQGPLADTSSAL